MSRTMSATEARVHFGDVLRAVAERGETVFIERGGKPQAVVVSIDEYKRLKGNMVQGEEEDWWDRVERARARFAEITKGKQIPDADDLINGGREEREAIYFDRLR
jgi:prevent-host-death family protein